MSCVAHITRVLSGEKNGPSTIRPDTFPKLAGVPVPSTRTTRIVPPEIEAIRVPSPDQSGL